ncbi:MAG TPA: hypothetical protein ENH87_10365 [Pricia antarctica]|uniref:Uncharacterized protein n=1 Tax=Pricia antarctica TaxID=641691 RepID=A0A831QQ72_9FLAO|nr:hypothetical protein [Pricia antarctica]
MSFKKLLAKYVILLLFFTGALQAQVCTLDIGGKNAETMVRVFQLNEAQMMILETLQGELDVETKSLNEQIEKLLASHPQSTEEELIKLADKYKVLQQKIVKASYDSDKKLLSEFNPKQYERYLQLCKAAIRQPISVVPKVYRDSIDPE